MSEFDFTEGGIARQHKLLDSRKEYDPRVAKFLAALDEIEKLRNELLLRDVTWLPEKDAEIERLRGAIEALRGYVEIPNEADIETDYERVIFNLFEALKGGEE